MDLVIIGGTLEQQQTAISELMTNYKSRISHLDVSQIIRTGERLIKTNIKPPASTNYVRLVTGITSGAEVEVLRTRAHTRFFHIYGPLPPIYKGVAIKATDHFVAVGPGYFPPHVLSIDEAYSECLVGRQPKVGV